MPMSEAGLIWIYRDYQRCSGCRRCEVACSVKHEGKIWPEASRVRVFMLVPGIEVPHLCAQCHDYPCVNACPVGALSTNKENGAVLVDKEKCIACGRCIEACPGKVPYIHPTENYAVICDLCGGDPECVKVCVEGGWYALQIIRGPAGYNAKLYARTPEEITKDLVRVIYGEEIAEEV
ncbi:MAG: 4Fe-4S dicluster domain-containing protein [Candidatus Bathyarchaeota archaeon]|nr:4Fe-4S dicluster domain-containing protein [Candidatus Bathyarchaeota archaeon]